MLLRIWSLVAKEFIQLARDRLMAVFIVLIPGLQLVLLAQALGQGISDLPVAILDQDNSAQSRALAQTLDNVPELVWRYQPADPGALAGLIEAGQAAAGVVIPVGFGQALATGSQTVVQVIVDGSNSTVGGSCQSYLESATGEFARRWLAARGLLARAPLALRTTVLYNPSLKSRPFMIPAQMGFIIYQVTLIVASLTFARERELGTLEQLLVTPLRPLELITGKAVLAWLVGLVNFLLMYAVAVYLFHVPMRGSFLVLLALSLLFVAVEIAYGIIISSVSRSQQQAVLYVFLLALLDVALSGYLVPVTNMPLALRAAATVSPLQHYLVIIRAVMLKGAGLVALWPHAAVLAGLGLGVGLLALATATRSLE